MLQTEAYQEVADGRCPLADNLRAVQAFLDYLVMKNVLSKNQRSQLCPK